MSSGISILPAINRNFSHAMGQSSSGIIAYGSRFHIYFLDIRSNPPIVLDSKFLYGAHEGRVIALSFCKSDSADLLASIGDECQIKIWDLETMTCLFTENVRESAHVVEWIHGSTNTLLYPSDGKTVLKWNIKSRTHVKIKTGSEITITTIVSNETSPHLAAVGHNNGTISVLNVVQEKLLHVLRSHTLEITSLSWSPIASDTLLSASLDFSLRMWRIEEEKPFQTYYVQTSRQKYDDKRKLRIVGVCHPKKPNAIICTNLRCEIGEVIFVENEKPRFSSYYMSYADNCKTPYTLFTITVDINKQKKLLLCCCDSFKITIADISEKKVYTQIPFLMGFVYEITNSTVNPKLLAISNGDGILRVWNSQVEDTNLDMISIYIHYKTKIMTAAWHPIAENILAYGTDEGRVGIVDIYKRKSVYCFETFHKDSVYCLAWGPCEKASKEDGNDARYYLYSCGGGIIYINKENDYKASALNLDDLTERPPNMQNAEKVWSEITWKQDYTCFCLGSFKGFIDVYNAKFIFLSRYDVQMKSVECLRWHPESTYASPAGSPLKFWIACGGSDVDIHIFDTTHIFGNEKNGVSQEATKKLVGHKKRVVSLCWSQHNDGFLVSASKDSTALVWNVCSGNIIATYTEHKDVVYGVYWSVFDKDVIYSGGQDSSVRIWKISQQNVSAPPDRAPARKRLRKTKIIEQQRKLDVKSVMNEDVSPENNDDETLTEQSSMEVKAPVQKVEYETQKKSHEDKDSRRILDEVSKSSKIGPYCSRKLSPLFPQHLFSKSINQEHLRDCMKLADILSEKQCSQQNDLDSKDLKVLELNSEDARKFGLFTDQLTAIRMLQAQEEQFKLEENFTSSYHLAFMAGNVKPLIEEAAKNGNLSQYLVSLAPSVSYKFWLEMCEKFAIQMTEEHQYYIASTYFLICGKLYEAINILAEKGNIIDALALAKTQLHESDPVITKLLQKSAKKYALTGNQIAEANCRMALKEPLAAAKTLSNTGDPNLLRVAAYICKKFNLEKEANEYSFLCMEKCLMACDWLCFWSLVDQDPKMQICSALVTIHESLYQHIRHLKKEEGISVKEIFSHSDSNSKVKIWSGCTSINSDKTFIEHVYNLLLSKSLLSSDPSSLEEMLEALILMSAKRKHCASAQAHITVAVRITEFVILSLLEKFDLAAEILLKIFEVAHNIVFLPKVVCFLLLPLGLYWCKDTRNFTCEIINSEKVENSTKTVPSVQNICKSVGEKIVSYQNQPIDTSTIFEEELFSNLSAVTDRISTVLSIKKLEDFIITYFVSSMVNDLMHLIGKKNLKVKCFASPTTENNMNKINASEIQLQNRLEGQKSNEGVVENFSTENETEHETLCNHNISLQEPVEHTVKEANENLQSFTEMSINEMEANHVTSIENPTQIILTESVDSNDLCISNGTDNYSSSKDNIHSEIVESAINDEQSAMQNLIELALKEADLKLQSMTETNFLLEGQNNETNHSEFKKASEIILNDSVVADNINSSNATENCSLHEDAYYEKVVESNVNEESSNISNRHAKCLQNVDLFCNLMSFITLNICKDEYALLYYLKEHLNVLSNVRASDALSMFSKEKPLDHSITTTDKERNRSVKGKLVDSTHSMDASKIKLEKEHDHCLKDSDRASSVSQESKESQITEVVKKDQNVSENANVELYMPECAASKEYDGLPKSSELQDCASQLGEKQSNADEKSQKADLDKTSLNVNHLEDHNYASQKTGELSEEIDTITEIQKSRNEYSEVAPIKENGYPSEQLQSEFSEVTELIYVLENKAQKSYPNPFDVIPKILQVFYNVSNKSECIIVKEKLHQLIHEIISWTDKFSIGEIKFLCENCVKRNGA